MKRIGTNIRLRDDDHALLKKLCEYYDLSESDVVKLILREYMKNHKNEIQS